MTRRSATRHGRVSTEGKRVIDREIERSYVRPAWLTLARAASRMRGELPMVLVDCVMVATAYTALLLLRFELDVPSEYWRLFGLFLPVALAVHLTANWLWGAYGQMWRHASVREARALLMAGLSSAIVLVVASVAWRGDRVPLSVVVVGPIIATILMGVARFQYRLFAFRRATDAQSGLRVAVVGAGAAGAAVIREMHSNDRIGMRPVVLLDDNPRVRGRALQGVPVVGGIDDLERVVKDYDVHQVLVALGTPGPVVARRIAQRAAAADVPVKVLPDIADMIHDQVSVKEARDLAINDLLGRRQADVDLERVRTLLRGRRVLVTGGGGSIGTEIASQVSQLDPAALVLMDHDETHLHEAAGALPEFTEQILADVRDRGEIDAVFHRVRPEIVFHAAAHKHVPILERHACQAIETNVFGTANIVEASLTTEVERLVLVSTDKAAAPISVMGASKWLAEQVLLARAPGDRRYCSVRFGNVLGSRGSVIPTFQAQIDSGGPVTVTDPHMTRLFMSTQEAVSLVLQASAVCENHEVFLLEMGEPVNILELAKRMIELNGRTPDEIDIQIIGQRPGEKLTEALHGPGERLVTSAWPSILSLEPVMLASVELDRLLAHLSAIVARDDNEQARSVLLDVAATATRSGLSSPNGNGDGASASDTADRTTRQPPK